VSWDPSTDHQVTGYIVSYGTSPGVYPHTLDVGNVTSITLADLASGIDYYIVVQSYNEWGIVGDASAAVVGRTADAVPHHTSVPRSLTTPRLSISCPVPTATAPNGRAVRVQLAPVATGGVPPLTTRCSPESGSVFASPATAFSCQVVDASGQTASCSSAVLILAPRAQP
jgi:hypothetical protein